MRLPVEVDERRNLQSIVIDEFTAEPENYDDRGDRIVVTGRFKGRAKSGAELNAPFEHIYEMKDGKIARLENKVDQEAWTAAWS